MLEKTRIEALSNREKLVAHQSWDEDSLSLGRLVTITRSPSGGFNIHIDTYIEVFPHGESLDDKLECGISAERVLDLLGELKPAIDNFSTERRS